MIFSPRSLSLLFALALGTMCAAPCRAEFLFTPSVVVSPEPGGLRYVYTLAVDPASNFLATDFSLTVAPEASLTEISAPAAWQVAYDPGDTEIYVAAPFDGSADIFPGTALTFSFLSPLLPGNQAYLSFGLDVLNPEFAFADGAIDGPTTAVPEPSTLVLAAAGVAIVLRRGRRHS